MFIHGHSKRSGRSPEYIVWKAMFNRCRNPKYPEFHRYGGRGITVCDRWYNFEDFLADMGKRPSKSYSLERKNNDLGYFPDNCCWATIAEQTRNRGGQRTNRLVTFQGKTMCVADASAFTGLPINTIHNRLNRGLLDEEACLTPRYRVRRLASASSVSSL